jgi:tRNA(Ser,Leu) C12 N-acetylase TAN1
MRDWNTVISVHTEGFIQACETLRAFGRVRRSCFYNVLLMRTTDATQVLEALRARAEEDAQSLSFLSRILPVAQAFDFQEPEEFEEKLRAAVNAWLPALAGKSFHVRARVRGFRGSQSSFSLERTTGEWLIEALEGTATPGRVTFTDPDAIGAIEVVGPRAGVALWTREEIQRYPFLGLK